jgi:hypothetical protein
MAGVDAESHRGGRCGSPQGATYAYSAMFMALALVKAGGRCLLYQSITQLAVSQQTQTVGDGPEGGKERRWSRGPGYPVGRYESGHIGLCQSSQQQCATVDSVDGGWNG